MSKLLGDLPVEIDTLLTWFEAGAEPNACGKELEEFACVTVQVLHKSRFRIIAESSI
jgi:hypothetical protein